MEKKGTRKLFIFSVVLAILMPIFNICSTLFNQAYFVIENLVANGPLKYTLFHPFVLLPMLLSIVAQPIIYYAMVHYGIGEGKAEKFLGISFIANGILNLIVTLFDLMKNLTDFAEIMRYFLDPNISYSILPVIMSIMFICTNLIFRLAVSIVFFYFSLSCMQGITYKKMHRIMVIILAIVEFILMMEHFIAWITGCQHYLSPVNDSVLAGISMVIYLYIIYVMIPKRKNNAVE